MTEEQALIEVFCCYACADETWMRKLETHLFLLKRQRLISLWHNRLIAPGTDWAKTIDSHLETASIILLLVSADFFASDYCYGIEMKRALEREGRGEVRVIPVLVRPTDWKAAPFAHLQTLPTDALPISSWQDEDTALADVAAGIRRVIVENLPPFPTAVPHTNLTLPSIWNLPYPRNPFFLGRKTELAQLRQRLRGGHQTMNSRPQAISGLGGMGKTQLVLEYAYRYHRDYQAILWVRAENTEALISSYVAIASLLRLPESQVKDQEAIVQAVKTWLRTNYGWLLIFDNADELALLPEFLPFSPGGHLLLTTQATAVGRLAQRLEIKNWHSEQGALFLLRRAGSIAPNAGLSQASPQDRALAVQITQEFGGLPLALDQAGAYLEETGISLSAYWFIYQHYRSALHRKRGGLVNDHPDPVAKTWALSFKKITEKHFAATDLLRVCAYLAPDAIPEEILIAGASFLGPILFAILNDTFLFSQAIEALRAYSLMQYDPQSRTFSIHRIVQVVIQDELTKAEQRMWAERAVLIVNLAFPASEYKTWSRCELLLPHALLAVQWNDKYQFSQPEVGRLLYAIALYLQDRVRYLEAMALYLNALHIQEQQLGPTHLDVAQTLKNLAMLYYKLGRYDQAEPLCLRALAIYEQQSGAEQLALASLLNNLAFLYRKQEKYRQAELLYRRALHIQEQQLGPDHSSLAHPLNSLATLYQYEEKYDEAELLYLRALHIQEQQLGCNHPDITYLFDGLGSLYYEQGRQDEAKSLYERSYSIQKQQLGLDSLRVASYFNRLMLAAYEQRNYAEAERLYLHHLNYLERKLGPDHPQVAHALNNVALLYQTQGKYDEAESFYLRALRMWEQQFGLDHPGVVYPLAGLARLYLEQGIYTEVEPLFLRALRIQEQQLGSSHPDIAEILYELGYFQEIQGNREGARAWYIRSLTIREQALGADHPKTIGTRNRLTALLCALEDPEANEI